MRLEPTDALLICFLGAREFMGFDFIVQHELQCRARDLVIVDNEYPALIDSF